MSAKVQVDKYFTALQRLRDRGEPISNDAVALEAGSGRGSIKKSRPIYADLIAAIERTAKEQNEAKAASDPLPELRQDIKLLKRRLDEALEREMCLLHEVYTLREENRQMRLGRPFVAPDPRKPEGGRKA
jgi:hypothetical protein